MESWRFVRENPETSEARDIAYAFWTDDEIALLDADHWLNVADSIEKHLQRQNR